MQYSEEPVSGQPRMQYSELRKAIEPLVKSARPVIVNNVDIDEDEIVAGIAEIVKDSLGTVELEAIVKEEMADDKIAVIVKRQFDQLQLIDVVKAAFDGMAIEHKEVVNNNHKTIVQEAKLPEELSKSLVDLAKAANKEDALHIMDFRPHDQDEPSDSAGYYGYQHPNGAWFIIYVVEGAKSSQERYAAGQTGYAPAWANRAELKYQTIAEAWDAL